MYQKSTVCHNPNLFRQGSVIYQVSDLILQDIRAVDNLAKYKFGYGKTENKSKIIFTF